MTRSRGALCARLFCACAVVLLSLGAGGQAAGAGRPHFSARAPAPVVRGSAYLALGDSVTFGYQEPQVVPPPNFKDAATSVGYPELLGATLHLKVYNAACPGETSSSLIDPNAQSNGCESLPNGDRRGFRTVYPLHVSYRHSQVAYAVALLKRSTRIRLVSLMIGGNDLLVCQETTADGCAAAAERAAALTRVARNVRTILAAIRHRAGYRGQLAIVNYYSADFTGSPVDRALQSLNATIDAAAQPYHVVVADGYDAFRTASLRFGSSSCSAGLITNVGGPGKCGIHPSYAGQALLAQVLAKAIRL